MEGTLVTVNYPEGFTWENSIAISAIYYNTDYKGYANIYGITYVVKFFLCQENIRIFNTIGQTAGSTFRLYLLKIG